MYIVPCIVSRVYYICLSVIIRNWRSAISAYYRITSLVARLLAFMTFFYSLDFFSFFLAQKFILLLLLLNVHCSFIYVGERWNFFSHMQHIEDFLFFILYLPLFLFVVIVNANYRRLLLFYYKRVQQQVLICVRVRKKRRVFDA
jgi:hypothetical protein